MLNRRQFLLTSFALLAVVQGAAAQPETGPALDPQFLPQKVDFTRDYPVGTIVVDTANRFLYLIESKNIARRYGIGVGRAGLAFSGTAEIGRKAKWPSWRPTDDMIRRNPGKYARYADGVPGGPNNPLGSRALYLYRDGQDTLYRIHGTTEPSSIGKAVSNGCFRMLNEHVEDLFERVPVGAKVVVD
ncbi:L,D-transpeptidase [Hoeflea sp.]|uniref:L,D-transpeptidase n=1 Tax=Hoeflea sp. TaxID=1940281 RepID=UPI003261EE4A